MSGGKGGSTTSSVTIPEYIEAAAQRNLNKAERISQIGYTPYYGPDVAGFTPMQQAAFQNTADTAGAFGMAAPSSQQDIYGGMAPPTEYAGGVQGYSAAPIYEQSLEALAQNRPGQKAYIDSFFIDPTSGSGSAGNFAPIDYTQYQTNAAAARAGGAGGGGGDGGDGGDGGGAGGGLSTPDYNYGGETYAGGDYANSQITNPAGGTGIGSITNTSAPGTFEGIGNDMGEALTGLAANTLPGKFLLGPSYNVGGANNPIKTPTINEVVTNAPSGMEYNPTTGSYSGGSDNVFTASTSGTAPVRPLASPNRTDSSDSGNTSDTGSGKTPPSVICAAMNKMGLLPDDIYALDLEFGLKVNREDPVLGDGYRLWALPVSEFIKKDTLGARALRAFLLPLTLAWAKEMAHQMRPDDYKPNYAGKVIMAIGHPTCRAIGHVFLGRLVKKDV